MQVVDWRGDVVPQQKNVSFEVGLRPKRKRGQRLTTAELALD
jgi:hypothetical protein